MKRKDIALRPLEKKDLDLVLKWRNSDEVRQRMFETDLITPQQHQRWFDSHINNSGKKCLIFEYKSEPAGVVTLARRDEAEDKWIWGCYLGNPGLIPKIGTIMGLLSMEYFFETMGIKTVIGEMVDSNDRSRSFNARLGFENCGNFFRTTSSGKNVEAVLLVLHREDWLKRKHYLLEGFIEE